METPSMLVPSANVPHALPSSPSFVHRNYLLLKAHYFLFFAGFGIIYPILNITLRSRGLSTAELAYINIIIPFLVFLTNPILGYIADKTRRYLSTFNFIFALATILYTIMFLLPNVKTYNIQGNLVSNPNSGRILNFCAGEEVGTKCASRSECGCRYQANCTSTNRIQLNFTFTMNPEDVRNALGIGQSQQCGIKYQIPVEEAIRNYQGKEYRGFKRTGSNKSAHCVITCSDAHFCQGSRYPNQYIYIIIYSLLFIFGNNFLSNAIALGASIGFATLEKPELFGRQRVFGTIGFGILALLASQIFKLVKREHVYIVMFSITTILCILITSFIRLRVDKNTPKPTIVEEKELEEDDLPIRKTKVKSQSQLSTLLPLLKKVDVIVFLLLTFIWGMPYAGLDPYLYLYVDEIAPCDSHSIIGWMSIASALAEIAGFFLAGKLLKLLGTNLASIVILLAFAVRFAGYYYISQPYLLTIMESMHFFNFGILYVLIVQKADSIAPPGLSGTLTGVALGITFGLGRGVGLLIASFIYTLIERRSLFLIISIFNLVVAGLFSIYFLLTRQRSKPVVEENEVTYDPNNKEEPLLVASTANEQ